MTVPTDLEIRAAPCPECYLCGTKGELLYSGLRDRLFGAPGRWDLKRCPVFDCGLIWLDPMPIEEDISKAYQAYYTHQNGYPRRRENVLRNLFRSPLSAAYELLLHAIAVRSERKRLAILGLNNMPPGKLLEVGCGNGRLLALLGNLGWQVEGQELDPEAAAFARTTYHVKVHVGPLNSVPVVEGSFDAIVMNHVIEHVHEPISVLSACHRLLKPEGKLLVVTPNTAGEGYRRFGSSWVHLDPPRHLHLFSCQTLRRIAQKAGLKRYETWTTTVSSRFTAQASLNIRHPERKVPAIRIGRYIAAVIFHLWAASLCLWRKDSGEECIIRVTK